MLFARTPMARRLARRRRQPTMALADGPPFRVGHNGPSKKLNLIDFLIIVYRSSLQNRFSWRVSKGSSGTRRPAASPPDAFAGSSCPAYHVSQERIKSLQSRKRKRGRRLWAMRGARSWFPATSGATVGAEPMSGRRSSLRASPPGAWGAFHPRPGPGSPVQGCQAFSPRNLVITVPLASCTAMAPPSMSHMRGAPKTAYCMAPMAVMASS